MAKKKTSLTPEQRLQEALVPESEWPYQVPKNWCWIKFGYLAKEMADGPFGSNLKREHYTENPEVRIIQLSNIGENGWREENTKYTTFEHAKSIARSIVEPGNLVIAKMMPAGRAILCPDREAQYVLSSDAVKCVPYAQLNSKFLLNEINSYYFQQQVQENTQGITRARTSIKKLKEYAFAVPPLAEQQRIVDRIESLFAKLDEAKQKAKDVLDGFETRKAAILHKAFTGELTTKWREEHSAELATWRNTTLGKIVNSFKYGTSEKSDYSYPGMPVFRIPNITDDGLSFDDLKFLPHHDVTDENQIHQNEILTIRSNGSRDLVGKSVLVPHLDRPYAYASFLIRIQPIKTVNPKFLVTYLNSADARAQMFAKAKSSSGINNINSKELGAITLNLPTIDEQQEIVLILDDLLSKEQQAKEAAESVLEQIDLIKKSILAHAFRGELGTNDPTEESSVELLKEILEKEA